MVASGVAESLVDAQSGVRKRFKKKPGDYEYARGFVDAQLYVFLYYYSSISIYGIKAFLAISIYLIIKIRVL